MNVLGFLSESCLPILSISCVNFQERDGRKLWSFTFLSIPSCWRKLNFVTSSLLSELLPRQSYRKSDFIHSPELAASCTMTSLEDNCSNPQCCLLLPKRPPKRGAGGPPSPPAATTLPASAAEQTVGPANFTLQLLRKVFQLLICITLSCCPRNVILQIQA